MLCGGGTGGHITPILAIAHEIKRDHPDTHIIYVGEHGGKFGHLVKNIISIDEVVTIYGGKLRRYHHESWFKRIFDVKSNLLNIRDVFYVLVGFFQSVSLIRKVKPDVILIKGGYVGVPVGLAAAFKHVPFITHDSDATPSLTTRVVGKWAAYNATGMPEHLYPYPEYKKRFVGVPVVAEYDYVTEQLNHSYRNDLDVPLDAKLLVVTGGSLGAHKLNKAMSIIIGELFEDIPGLYIIHQVGKGNTEVYGDFKNPRLRVVEFIPNLYKFTGAADVVVTRSGATTIAELAVQGKATIIIPNPQLTGGQQSKNAEQLAAKHASVVILEKELSTNPTVLAANIASLLNNPKQQALLSENLHEEAVSDSASKIAVLLLSLAK